MTDIKIDYDNGYDQAIQDVVEGSNFAYQRAFDLGYSKAMQESLDLFKSRSEKTRLQLEKVAYDAGIEAADRNEKHAYDEGYKQADRDASGEACEAAEIAAMARTER